MVLLSTYNSSTDNKPGTCNDALSNSCVIAFHSRSKCLLYDCEIWNWHDEDVHRLEVFDHWCLRSIPRTRWNDCVSNEKVRNQVLCIGTENFRSKLIWLSHLLGVASIRLPYRVLFSVPHTEWKKSRGGQQITWQLGARCTASLDKVGVTPLRDWCPNFPSTGRLEALRDMGANCEQWTSCRHFLSSKVRAWTVRLPSAYCLQWHAFTPPPWAYSLLTFHTHFFDCKI